MSQPIIAPRIPRCSKPPLLCGAALILFGANLVAGTLLTEDAESASPDVTLVTSGEYSAVQSDLVPQGNKAFSLGHMISDTSDQSITLTTTFSPTASTNLYFESKLGWASSSQVAFVEISTDGGSTWTSIWNRAGTSDAGESMFSLQTLSLVSFAGKTATLRFRFSYSSGSFYPKSSPGVGWYFDNVQIGNSFVTREWSIGSPTAQEQLVIELLNRARSDSQAELQRLINTTDEDTLSQYDAWSVDLNILTSQFDGSQYGPKAQEAGQTNAIPSSMQPLAPNAKLTAAARLHSQDMFQNQFQGHGSSSGAISPNQPGDSSGQRATHQGFSYKSISENVSAYSSNAWNSQAGFIVDWGISGSTGGQYGGMQDPPGHRFNVFEGTAREVGVGILEGSNGSVGPYLVTHNLGVEQNYDQPFITGVAFYDIDGDGFYSAGEGIGGVTVKVQGGVYHAVTPDSGGFAMPLTSNGSYACTFIMPDESSETETVTVSNLENAKLVISPIWSATTLTSPSSFVSGTQTTITTATVPGATSYKLHAYELSAWVDSLTAESTGEVNATTSAGYSFRQSGIKANGTFAYRLLSNSGDDQYLEIDQDVLSSATGKLAWQDRLGAMSSFQEARVEVSIDNGKTWTVFDKRQGPGTSGNASFVGKSLDLSAYSGIPIRVRFRIYNPNPTQYYSNTDDGFGWYVDDIAFSDSDILVNAASLTSVSSSWNFTSAENARYFLRGQVINNTNEYALGPGFRIEATENSGAENSAPVLTNPTEGGILSTSVEEGNLSIVTLSAFDANNDPVTFYLSEGTNEDTDHFEINATTGVLSFRNPSEHANPDDVDGDNVYVVTVSYTDGIDPASSIVVKVTVTAAVTFNLTIQVQGQGTVTGADAGTYKKDATVSLTANPSSGNKFSNWMGDASGAEDTVTLNIDANKVVTAVFEKINAVPFLTNTLTEGILAFSMSEKQTEVLTLTADDDDDEPVTFAIAGTDSEFFELNNTTGVLRFVAPPDYESPTDGNADNTYELEVTVSDGKDTSSIVDVEIAVKNTAAEFSANLTLAAYPEEGGKITTDKGDLTYAVDSNATILGTANFGYAFSHWTGDTNNSANPLTIKMTENKSLIAVFTKLNTAPSLTNTLVGGIINVEINENNASAFQFTADDEERDPITFDLNETGDYSLFDLNASTGSLTFKTPPDFEVPSDSNKDNLYELSVKVSDGNATSLSTTVKISVVDLAENEWIFAEDKGSDWRSLAWFGNYYETSSGWIYHEDLGWLYRTGDVTSHIWFYDPELKSWLWTASSVYPYFYSEGTAEWLYYERGSKRPRKFYNFNSGEWVESPAQ